ncbi:MAG: tetratricopeptide repeat protein [Gemmatimonadales bacterium]
MSHRPVDWPSILDGWLDEGQAERVLAWHRVAEPSRAARPGIQIVAASAAARTGDYELAVELAGSACSGFAAARDDRGRFRALNLLGGVSFERGRLVEALAWFERARRVAAQLDDDLLLAKVANNQASILHLRGDQIGAERAYLDALASFERAGDYRGRAQVLQNLAIVAREAGDPTRALSFAKSAVGQAEAHGDPAAVGMALTALAEAEIAVAPALAPRTLARARALARQSGDRVGLAEIERVSSLYLSRMGDLVAASRAAAAALQQATALDAQLVADDARRTGARARELAGRASV